MRFDALAFPGLQEALEAHDRALRDHGGAPGLRDPGQLQAALAAPQSGYLATLAEMAATYVHGLARGHAFVDGNKRTAAIILMMFLGANGFPAVLSDEWVEIVEHVADGSTTKHQLVDQIVARLLGGVDVTIEY